jgi:hypothetical protein
LLTQIERRIRYAYLVTLVGVVLATVTTVYTAIRSFMVTPRFGSLPPGNFNRTRAFGNFTATRPFVNVSPYNGFANGLAIVAVIIAIVGVVWLGLSLRKSHSQAT